MSVMKTKPMVFEYLEVLAYLQDYYSFRKQGQMTFSYDKWCEELGLNNRSFLRLVIKGKKKIPTSFIDSFCRQVFSTKGEQDYFRCLVRYSQAANHKERQSLSSELINLIKLHCNAQLIEEKSEFISTPLLPRIFCILSFKDLIASSENIAKWLGVPTSVIDSALALLEEMKLAEKKSVEGVVQWHSATDVFKVPDYYGSTNLMRFHAQSLEDAISAYQQSKELRRYKSLFVPMSEEDLKEFNKALDEFSASQMLRFNSKVSAGKRMFQANFNVHSVSQVLS